MKVTALEETGLRLPGASPSGTRQTHSIPPLKIVMTHEILPTGEAWLILNAQCSHGHRKIWKGNQCLT